MAIILDDFAKSLLPKKRGIDLGPDGQEIVAKANEIVTQDPTASLTPVQKVLTSKPVDAVFNAHPINTILGAAERYPAGIMKSLEGLQIGQPSNPLLNIFTPTPDPRSAVTIAQDMGQRIMPPVEIQDPQSKLQYLKAMAQSFGQNLPFTTAGVTTDVFTNPLSALIGGVAQKAAAAPIMQKEIAAPKMLDEAVMKVIDTFDAPLGQRIRQAKIDKKVVNLFGDVKEQTAQKQGTAFKDWQAQTQQTLAKYSEPGVLESEIAKVGESLGKPFTPQEIASAKTRILDHWGRAVFQANTTKTPLEIMSPKRLLTGNKGQMQMPDITPDPSKPGEIVPNIKVPAPIPTTPIHEEARKYKTAEEFIKAQKMVYHGSGAKFEAFDKSLGGSITGAKSGKEAVWFTDDPATAKAYSVYAAETGPVKALLDKADVAEKIAQKSGKQSDWDKYDEFVRQAEELDTYEKTYARRENANIVEASLKGDFYEVDAGGKTPQELNKSGDIDSWLNEQISKAKKSGKSGIIIKNLDDAVGLHNRPSTHYAVFDTKNIIQKSQLTSIWNEANKQAVAPPAKPPIEPPVAASPAPEEPNPFEEADIKQALKNMGQAPIEPIYREQKTDKELVQELSDLVSTFESAKIHKAKQNQQEYQTIQTKSSWLPQFSERGYTQKYLQNIYKKFDQGVKLTSKQAADLVYTFNAFTDMMGIERKMNIESVKHLWDKDTIGIFREVKKILNKKTVLALGQVKPTIAKTTGISKEQTPITSTREQLLKRELQQEQKASKEGYLAGAKDARARAIAELKNMFGNERQLFKDTLRNQRLKDDIIARDKVRVKKEIIAYAKEKLPVESQGKFLTAIGNAQTASHLSEAFRRVDQEAKNIERKDIIEKIKTDSSKALESGKVAVEHKKMIEEIMGGIELTKRRPETLDRLRRTREYIEKQKAQGKNVEMPERILNQLEILHRQSVDKLSTGELKSIHANIQDLVKIGSTKLKSRQAIYDMEKERITNDLVAGTMALEKNPLIVAEAGEKLSLKDKFENVFHKFNRDMQHIDLVFTPMDTFFDLLDGGHATFDGPNYRHFKVAMDTDYQTYLRDANKDSQAAISLAKELKLDDQNFERIGVYAQVMQEGGRQKLLDRGMTDKQIDAIVLTDDEMRWYKASRKLLEALRPGIEETMKNVWNKPLGHVKNYWPMMTDFDALTDTEVFERFGEGVPEIVRATKKTPQGFTKERTGGYQPVKVNAMDVLLKHMDDAHYLINMSRRIKMLTEIANSDAVKAKSGDLGSVMTKEWLDLMARKGGMAGQQRIAILDVWRRNFGIAQLGLNVTSALIQPTALLDGAAVIGNYAFDGTLQIIVNRKARAFVFENMPELKARVGDDPAFIDFGDNKFMTKAGEIGYAPLKFLDGITASGVAYGAYVQKIKELGLKLDLDNPNKEAIAYAQSIVRQTQSSSLFKDAPLAISRGKLTGNKSFDKALLQFQSFMLTRWNVIRNRLWRANIQGGRDSDPTKKNFKMAFLIVSMLSLALALEASLRRGIRWGTDKLTGKVTKEKTTLTENMILNMVTTIPFISQGVSMAVYKGDPIPSLSGIRDVSEGVYSIGKAGIEFAKGETVKDKSKVFVDTLAGVGSMTGIPATGQIRKILRSAIDSDSKKNIVDIYEQALREPDSAKQEEMKKKAREEAINSGVLISDVEESAKSRIKKEIGALMDKTIETLDKKYYTQAMKLAATAHFSVKEFKASEKAAIKRDMEKIKKGKEIESQNRLKQKIHLF